MSELVREIRHAQLLLRWSLWSAWIVQQRRLEFEFPCNRSQEPLPFCLRLMPTTILPATSTATPHPNRVISLRSARPPASPTRIRMSNLLSPSRPPMTIKPLFQASVTYQLNVTASSIFNGTVALGVAHLAQSCTWDATGKVSCSAAATRATFDRPSVAPSPGATVPVAMTIQTAASPAPILGTAAIEVVGQSGAIENAWEGSLTVADTLAPD